MLINGNEVNNLFLGGTRFRCLENCFVVPDNTYCDYLIYNVNLKAYRVAGNINQNGVYLGSIVGRTYIFSSEIYKGTVSDICKIYGSKLSDPNNYINPNKIFYSFKAMNTSGNEIYLFSENTYEDLPIEKHL